MRLRRLPVGVGSVDLPSSATITCTSTSMKEVCPIDYASHDCLQLLAPVQQVDDFDTDTHVTPSIVFIQKVDETTVRQIVGHAFGGLANLWTAHVKESNENVPRPTCDLLSSVSHFSTMEHDLSLAAHVGLSMAFVKGAAAIKVARVGEQRDKGEF